MVLVGGGGGEKCALTVRVYDITLGLQNCVSHLLYSICIAGYTMKNYAS